MVLALSADLGSCRKAVHEAVRGTTGLFFGERADEEVASQAFFAIELLPSFTYAGLPT